MWLPHNNRSLSRFDNTELLVCCFDFIAAETAATPEALAHSCDVNALDSKDPATNLPAPDSTHPAVQSQYLRQGIAISVTGREGP
jgi:hypothetical protein